MKRLLSLALLPLAAGCYTITYVQQPVVAPADHKDWHHRVVNGIVELEDPFPASHYCPDGLDQIRTETTVANWAASYGVRLVLSWTGVALGVDVYNPSTISVWCSSSSTMVEEPEASAIPGWD